MSSLTVLQEVPKSRQVIRMPEALETAGGRMFTRFKLDSAREQAGVVAGTIAAGNTVEPALSWQRKFSAGVLSVVLFDRRKTSGGFGMVAVQANYLASKRTKDEIHGEVYVFGNSGDITGIRREFAGPVDDQLFGDSDLMGKLLFSRPGQILTDNDELSIVSTVFLTVGLPKPPDFAIKLHEQ